MTVTTSTLPSCRTDPEAWFPVGKTGTALDRRAEAIRRCHQCPVFFHCSTIALSGRLSLSDGIMAGLDFAPERAHLPHAAHAPSRAA